MSAPFYTTLFGHDSERVLTSMFRHKRNLFSYEHTLAAESGGELAGMLLCYDYVAKQSESIPTALALFRELKSDMLLKLPVLISYYSVMDIVRKGDFYLNNLAVYPEHRGKHIATSLISAAGDEAKCEKAVRLTLEAEKENIDAVRLYEKLGFSTYAETRVRVLGDTNFLRMSKPL